MKAKLIRLIKSLQNACGGVMVTFIKRGKQYQIPGKAAFLLQTHTTSRKESS